MSSSGRNTALTTMAGGIVHRQEQGEVGDSFPQPGMIAAVNLH